MSIQTIILAAGEGKRMQSNLPKVLQTLAGKPLIKHVLEKTSEISNELPPIIVYGYRGEQLKSVLKNENVIWVSQAQQLGTGHAVLQALPVVKATQVLILYGDVPLITAKTLNTLIQQTPKNSLGMIVSHLPNPLGYGRIIRDGEQHVVQIIEEKDASAHEKLIKEVNPGIYFVAVADLKKWLPKLNNHNGQKEYYLTDIITHAVNDNVPIVDVPAQDYHEVLGINDRIQLATLERYYQQSRVSELMMAGATVVDPARVDVRGEINLDRDVTIDINVILAGRVRIGEGCYIGPSCILKNVELGNHVEVKAHSILEDAKIADHCQIGPFARIRPGTTLGESVHIGNFVEIKNTIVGQSSKINHLSYIGDATVGSEVNIGAGTITCNYDGANKHQTVIGDRVHIGSDTQLIAPVTIGEGATIGAGSTITKSVPNNQMTLTHHLEQRAIEGWIRPKKQKV